MPDNESGKILDFTARLREKVQKPRGMWADLVEELDAQGVKFNTVFTDDQVVIAWDEPEGRAAAPFWAATGEEVHPRV